MKCLIVAAGKGGRLREWSELKPLVPLQGVPLIKRVIDQCRRAGVDDFLVVSGYRGGELRTALDAFAIAGQLKIAHVVNDQWERGNGVSVLCGKPALQGPFLLSMCDHLVDPAILRSLMAEPVAEGGVALAVDYNIENDLIDLDDVTRVQCVDGRIRAIGKMLPAFNCFDTGMFQCSTGFFGALEESQSNGDDSISGAMNVLARRNLAFGMAVDGRVWIDIDDLVAFRKAEKLLDAARL